MVTKALIFFACTFATISGDCPNGWTRYDDSCYRIFDKLLEWPEAQFACEQENAFLAVIETRQESLNIHALVKEFNLGATNRDNIWIGLADMRHEGVWVWENSKQNTTFFDWADGEPNGLKTNEDCVEMWSRQHHKWADVACTRKLHYLCERELTTPVF